MTRDDLQEESRAALAKVIDERPMVVSGQAMRRGLDGNEPLLLCLDGLLRYARAYQARYETPLCADYVLGPAWLDAIKGVHGLLDGDGAVAMERGISTDSKDNGALEAIYWAARTVAGFTDETA